MKLLKNIALTAGLSAMLGSLTVSAQDVREIATIPFDYNVGQQSMPSGNYMVAKASPSAGVFRLSDQASGHSIFLSSVPQDTSRNGESKLVFSCYAGECSLAQIWIQGNSYKLTAKPLPREAKNNLGVVAMVSVPLLSR